MKTPLALSVALALPLLSAANEAPFSASAPDGSLEERHPWTDKPLLNERSDFQFVVVTDRTGGHRDGVFEQAVSKINLLRPEFVVSVGDLVEGYYDDPIQSVREWTEFDGMVDALDMRFFYVPGNHDIWSPFSREVWEERFGSSYYHFIYRDVLFLALNSEDGASTTIGQEQARYFVEVLEAHPEVRWTLVFTHKPLWYYDERGSETGWASIQDQLVGRPHTVFAGHRHQYIHYEREGMRYIDLATTGGGSSLAGPAHGRFDHFVWVTMTQEGPVLANVLLDGIVDERIRTEESAEELNRLGGSVSMELPPVTWAGAAPAETVLRVRNDAEQPLRLTGRFGLSDHEGIKMAPHAFQAEIGAQSEWELPVTVRGLSINGEDVLTPLDWQVSYQTATVGETLWEFRSWLAVEGPKRVVSAPPTLQVDGMIGEWDSWQATLETPMHISGARSAWTGPDDARAHFTVAADAEWLYIAGVVKDDVWIDKPGATVGSQDYLVLTVLPYGDDAVEAEERAPWTFSATPSSALASGGVRGPDALEGHYRFAGLGSESGYAFEFAVSVEALEAAIDEAWTGVRVNVGLGDVDAHTGSRPTIWWKSPWSFGASARGLGRFQR